jgi:hypothetical protein
MREHPATTYLLMKILIFTTKILNSRRSVVHRFMANSPVDRRGQFPGDFVLQASCVKSSGVLLAHIQ